MKKLYIYILIALPVLVTGCDDYVDIRTEGKLVPEETINYRYLLNNVGVLDYSYDLIDVCSDDIAIKNEDQVTYLKASTYYRPFLQSYMWEDSIYFEGEADYKLQVIYTALYYVNLVISEVMDSKEGTEDEKKALKGEALVHRAFFNLQLVNIYGKAYDPATSETDLGIPMFTEATVEAPVFRSTVAEVYELIESDLLEAITLGLPATSSGNLISFPSQAAAYAMLARTYLYMGNYEDALTYAQYSLDIQNSLVNLADYEGGFSYPTRQYDPEIIWSKNSLSSYSYSPTFLTLSDELESLFDVNDMRFVVFTRPASYFSYTFTEGNGYYRENLNYESRNAGPSVPEMMLIKAECQARAGATNDAMQTINDLRQNRFRAADYVAMTATDSEDALVKVLEERRRELMCRGGFRWFDLKRLNKDARFRKTITHDLLGETVTLDPDGDRYQFQFPAQYFQYAPDLKQNP